VVAKDKGLVALVKKAVGLSTGDCCGGNPTAPQVGDPDGGAAPCCGEPADSKKETVKPGGEKPDDSSDCC